MAQISRHWRACYIGLQISEQMSLLKKSNYLRTNARGTFVPCGPYQPQR